MPKTIKLSIEKRLRIKLLFEQGKSQTKIAREVNCSRCAVQYTLNRYKKTGSYQNRKKKKKKRITTVREDRNLIRHSLRNRKNPLKSLLLLFLRQEGNN